MTSKSYQPHQDRRKRPLLFLFILILSPLFLFSCSSRSITKPRSEIIADARDNGVRLPTLREEAKLFFAEEARSKRMLKKLLSQRSLGYGSTSTYRVGAGDKIEINVFDIAELNTQAKVRESGFITLPLIGAVRALGYTESELQDHIKERLKTFVRNPEVYVSISEYESQKVSVLGAVHTPGTYALKKGKNSIVEILSLAGGLSEKAGGYIHFVPMELHDGLGRGRSSSGIELSLSDVLGTEGDLPVAIPIVAGDTIIIPEAGQVMVEGEVEKRGAYEIADRTTLLGALASAGGITYSAKIDEVEVIRDRGNAKRRLIVDLERILSGEQSDVGLRNGDIIRVPSHSGRRMRQDTFDGITRIINFGVGGTVNMAK